MHKSIKINGRILSRYSEILSDDALQFVEEIHNSFNNKRLELLKERKKRQKAIDEGYKLDFLNETKKIRDATWKIKNIPKDLLKRQVEITGPPVPKKMFISALNSGADCYMTDFEDSLTPTFDNLIKGQLNVKDAVNKKIDFIDKKTGKNYKLNEKTSVLIIRPRGLHLDEKNIKINNERISGTFFDLGISLFHNAKQLVKNGMPHKAERKTGDGDAQLTGTEIGVEVSNQMARHFCAPVTFHHQRLELRVTHFDECKFRCHKETVEHHKKCHREAQQNNGDHFAAVHQTFTSPKTVFKISGRLTIPSSRLRLSRIITTR